MNHPSSPHQRCPRPRLQRPAVLAAILLLLSGLPLFAGDRDLSMADPADVGLDPAGIEKLNETMHAFVDDGQLAGVITAVARQGKLVNFDVYGHRDLENKTPMTKDTIFRIYSMTKPIAGVALMTLYEEGRFKLDDPVEKYIPQLENVQVAKEDGEDGMPVTEPQKQKMTIRQLMSHTGGLTYGLFARSQVDSLYTKANILDRDSTLEQFADKLGKIPLKTQPGTAWEYSVSVDLQGYLVEVLSGQTFDVFLEERIFEPLGMKDTAFWVEPSKADRLSRLYIPGAEGKLTSQPNGEYLTKPGFFSGGGGLASTATDYLRFAQMLLNGGELDGVRILKPETVKLMHTNQLPDSIEQIHPMIGTPGNTFGVDFAIVERPDGTTDHELAQGEYWWYGIGGTWFGINPKQDTVVVGMIQLMRGRAARDARLGSKMAVYEAISDPN